MLYLLVVLAIFVGGEYGDPNWNKGGIPLLMVTFPCSVPALLLGYAIAQIPIVDDDFFKVAGYAYSFFLFFVLSAGTNAAPIFGPSRVWRFLRGLGLVVAIVVIASLLVAVQVIMPMVHENALEYRRPNNVPKTAIYTGPAVGWWQLCSYDASTQSDHCKIWNYGGLVLVDEDFVPYDAGRAPTDDGLRIDPDQGNPYMVTLRNGRILIPKSRESEMRRSLDRVYK